MPIAHSHNSLMTNQNIIEAIQYANSNGLNFKVTLFDMATIIDQHGGRTCSDDHLEALNEWAVKTVQEDEANGIVRLWVPLIEEQRPELFMRMSDAQHATLYLLKPEIRQQFPSDCAIFYILNARTVQEINADTYQRAGKFRRGALSIYEYHNINKSNITIVSNKAELLKTLDEQYHTTYIVDGQLQSREKMQSDAAIQAELAQAQVAHLLNLNAPGFFAQARQAVREETSPPLVLDEDMRFARRNLFQD